MTRIVPSTEWCGVLDLQPGPLATLVAVEADAADDAQGTAVEQGTVEAGIGRPAAAISSGGIQLLGYVLNSRGTIELTARSDGTAWSTPITVDDTSSTNRGEQIELIAVDANRFELVYRRLNASSQLIVSRKVTCK